MFWRVGLPHSGGEGYSRSITFKQAVALALFEGNPVYVWEGRDAAPPAAPKGPAAAPEAPGPAPAEGARGEGDRLAARRRAATLAADMMEQGCEVCQTHYITWVALGRREGCDAIVVCDACVGAYDAAPAVHKLYEWHRIAELVDEGPGFVCTRAPPG